jgi:hypothetical protein
LKKYRNQKTERKKEKEKKKKKKKPQGETIQENRN